MKVLTLNETIEVSGGRLTQATETGLLGVAVCLTVGLISQHSPLAALGFAASGAVTSFLTYKALENLF